MNNSFFGEHKGRNVVVYGGSFNPPAKHHLQIVETLIRLFDVVLIVPCGPRKDKASVDSSLLEHRKKMVELNFSNLEKIQFDFQDLDKGVYTPTYFLYQRYLTQFPDDTIWFAVGSDIIYGGRNRQSEIHRIWHEGERIWNELNYFIIFRPGYNISPSDMPPSSKVIVIEDLVGHSSAVRYLIANGQSIDHLVLPQIVSYIMNNHLYEKGGGGG